MQVPTPSIARFGRLAGLDSEKVTTRQWAQTSTSWPPRGTQRPCGGSDLEGKQNRRPEQQRMTTAPKEPPYRSRCTDFVACRPCPNGGKADVPREETSAHTLGTAGVGVQASGERSAEITSGRSRPQQGLTATCKDPPHNTRKWREETGLARESVVARTEG